MSARPLLLVALVLGVMLVATIGLAATRPTLAAQTPGRRLLGWLLIAVPLPLVVASRLFLSSSPLSGATAFVAGVLAFAAGAVLVLSGREDTDDGGVQAYVSPAPWWPEFERQFQAYARRQSRPRVRI
jgi:FtsH-binding integral membrane protein